MTFDIGSGNSNNNMSNNNNESGKLTAQLYNNINKKLQQLQVKFRSNS